jgi:hypothetical protein
MSPCRCPEGCEPSRVSSRPTLHRPPICARQSAPDRATATSGASGRRNSKMVLLRLSCATVNRNAENARFCCRSSVVEHSLGKGEVDSSILSGSTRKDQRIRGNPNGSGAFGDFRRERSATENPAKSGNDPVTSANSDTLVTRGDAFCSVFRPLRCDVEHVGNRALSAALPLLKDATSCASSRQICRDRRGSLYCRRTRQ